MTTNNQAARSSASTGSTDAEKAELVPEKHSTGELRVQAARARAELASTLDAIEYKLNLPKQLRINRRRVTHALRQLGEDSPPALVGIALGAATVVGVIVWFGASAVAKNR